MTSDEPVLDDFLIGKVAGVLQLRGYGYPANLIRACLEGHSHWQTQRGEWLEVKQVTRDICTYAAKEAGVL
jgi:hypothetical protein